MDIEKTATAKASRPENPNKNMLAGMSCPRCGSHGRFIIVVTAIATVDDDGVDGVEDIGWNDLSACTCKACGQDGTVLSFSEEGREDADPDDASEEA